ncbi:MAG: bacteriocin immunity protein [Pseudomonas sp.]|uniref:bacteriocin immunity protein n=1 Tax=Pseudomonas sp. TaxID=306 RepID=UPI003D1133F1
MNTLKSKISEYTEHEFKAFIKEIEEAATEELQSKLIVHFNKIVPHPAGSDLLFYPEPGEDESADGIIKIINSWCTDNQISGFKN